MHLARRGNQRPADGAGSLSGVRAAMLSMASCGKPLSPPVTAASPSNWSLRGYHGTVGITAATSLVALPSWTTTGPAARATDSQQNAYAALGGGTITSAAVTLDPTALAASLRVYGLASSDQYQVFLLSGTNFTTSTTVSQGNAPQNTWTTVPFAVAGWAGQQLSLLYKGGTSPATWQALQLDLMDA